MLFRVISAGSVLVAIIVVWVVLSSQHGETSVTDVVSKVPTTIAPTTALRNDTSTTAPRESSSQLNGSSTEAEQLSPSTVGTNEADQRVRSSCNARNLFPDTQPFLIADYELQASVARSARERQVGLSNTPCLPANAAKVFVFESSSRYGFWMKDMQYAIDILWVSANGRIVHIESAVAPDSYPETFTPNTPARYVIETNAGWAQARGIATGTLVTFPWERDAS